jgi:ubiquinone/menaquinone biosynthesis C-methylase UbiE
VNIILDADIRSFFTEVSQEAGQGVDIVLTDVYHLPFEDGSVDIVLSGQMLEHCGQFWRVFNEIFRVLKPDGLAFVIAPSSGPVHRYPVDCYRFLSRLLPGSRRVVGIASRSVLDRRTRPLV